MKSIITGVGGYLPEKIVTNKDLEKIVDTSDEWIRERTGIKERRIAAEGELTSDLAVKAATDALKAAGRSANEIDLIVVATCTPDLTMPSTAAIVGGKLGNTRAAAFDLNAACSGFVYALGVVDGLLKSGSAKKALLIAAETFSRILDWSDRGTCVLFGDGAGAVVVEAVSEKEAGGRGILYSNMFCDGSLADLLITDGGVSLNQKSGTMKMKGQEVFKHATVKMIDGLTLALEASGLKLSDIDWLIPHQANSRIINMIISKTGIAPEKVVQTIAVHSNTSAASIPLALNEALKNGRVKPGNLVALQALGSGITWGASLIRW